jgi:hypothetical protein
MIELYFTHTDIAAITAIETNHFVSNVLIHLINNKKYTFKKKKNNISA